MFGFFKRRRRERLRAAPFPPEWDGILRKNVPLYGRLDEADRKELHGHIHVFLAEKHFEGCGGLALTDEIQVTIAAQACLLLLHRDTDYYRRLITILVYPSAYMAKGVEPIGGGVVLEGEQARLGEAWTGGVVVLSWDDVRAGASDIHDGHNVVLHEFAHQLDQEDGVRRRGTDPRPPQPVRRLGSGARGPSTSSSAGPAVGEGERARRLRGDQPGRVLRRGDRVLLREAGPLRRKHPELYEELKEYYRQDPERAVTGGGGASSAGTV